MIFDGCRIYNSGLNGVFIDPKYSRFQSAQDKLNAFEADHLKECDSCRRRQETRRFHLRVAQAYDATGQTAQAEAARRAARQIERADE